MPEIPHFGLSYSVQRFLSINRCLYALNDVKIQLFVADGHSRLAAFFITLKLIFRIKVAFCPCDNRFNRIRVGNFVVEYSFCTEFEAKTEGFAFEP